MIIRSDLLTSVSFNCDLDRVVMKYILQDLIVVELVVNKGRGMVKEMKSWFYTVIELEVVVGNQVILILSEPF